MMIEHGIREYKDFGADLIHFSSKVWFEQEASFTSRSSFTFVFQF